MQNITRREFIKNVALGAAALGLLPYGEVFAASRGAADLVVYGKIFTSEGSNWLVEAFAVKDGKFIYVGNKAGALAFIERGKTEIIDYTGKGLVMPGCGNGHAHYKSFFDYGIPVSIHSDYPAISGSADDPFGIMEIAVTGTYHLEKGKPIWTEELVTREQALSAMTMGCAQQMFIENERGSIRPGKFADFLLVSKDVLTCPASEIHEARPVATYFEGKKVFSGGVI